MATYSFLDTNAVIAGPGGVINLAAGAAAAEEGISLEPSEDKNVMSIGADGRGQHSLIASDAGVFTARFLKTSPTNAKLMAMYNLQTSASILHGTNTVTVSNTSLGDLHILQSVAFKKKPAIVYGKEGPMIEWTFDAIKISSILGAGNILP